MKSSKGVRLTQARPDMVVVQILSGAPREMFRVPWAEIGAWHTFLREYGLKPGRDYVVWA